MLNFDYYSSNQDKIRTNLTNQDIINLSDLFYQIQDKSDKMNEDERFLIAMMMMKGIHGGGMKMNQIKKCPTVSMSKNEII
jgi:hypothetical protein